MRREKRWSGETRLQHAIYERRIGGVKRAAAASRRASSVNYTGDMHAERSPAQSPLRPTVFLPCHTLDDFPYWLDEHEADELLAAWTAAWHPAVIAGAGEMPVWASVDLPPPTDMPVVGIVPAFCDDRFAAQFDASSAGDSRWVRGVADRAAVVAAAAAAVEAEPGADGRLPGSGWEDDFRALGLGVLLSELLARRMRSSTDLDSGGFGPAVVAAARAAVEGRDDDVRAGLQECFGWLEGWRARYYPVDFWLLDLVLLAASTLGRPLAAELESPVPFGIVTSSALIARLARDHAPNLAALRERVAAGTVSICGGAPDEEPLDDRLPEELRAWLAAGIATCHEHLGAAPATFARYAGGSSAILPQLLHGLGIDSAIWNQFDGSALPDPGTGRIRWEGTGGGCIEAVARPPLDARSARSILELPERIGDTLDHDHVAVIAFAHHAGTAGPWHALLRRIGKWTTALGTFVTPAELFTRTAGSGTPASFEPDAFAPLSPPGSEAAAAIDRSVDRVKQAAGAAVAARGALVPLLAAAPLVARRSVPSRPANAESWWARGGGWFGGAARQAADRVLDNGLVRLEAHASTGGMLSLRRPSDRGNRLSQQLAFRTAGDAITRMQAERIDRGRTAIGSEGLVSTGRLLAEGDREAGTFRQEMTLVAGLPLAVLDVEVVPAAPFTGPLFESHACCRFAWNENESVEVRRSLHGQSIVTERARFTAPHFIELRGGGGLRAAASDDRDAVAILTGGLPWHMLSSPHVLDSILTASGATPATAVRRRLAVGLGLERPWDLALELLADAPLGPPAVLVPPNVRVVHDAAGPAADGVARARIGLVESAGRTGNVRIEWGVPVARATAVDLRGEPRDDVTVAIEGRTVVVFLRRYEWMQLDLEFGT